MDRYNGREMGSRLARAVFDFYDPTVSAAVHEQSSVQEDELPTFFLPQGNGGKLPNNMNYYYIKTTSPLVLKEGEVEEKNRPDMISDNINEEMKGHYIKFTFNKIGLIDSVTYLGTEDIVVQSLWSFVGLHENYLNRLTSRYEAGIIPNVTEFLSENWAMALYHEWFGDFCLRIRLGRENFARGRGFQDMEEVKEIMTKIYEMTKNSEGVSRDQMSDLMKLLDPTTVKLI